MLRKVRSFPYEMPLSLSSPLALLITEVIIYCISAKQRASWTVRSSSAHFPVQLLCKTPSRRLRTLDRFQRQTFFRGSTFDLDLLQRQPMEVTDETSECPRFGCFLCKLKHESWLLLSVAVRWFWSCGRDRTERPKLDEASLCPYSLSKASTTTRSSAHPPRHTRSRIPAQTLTQLYRCLAQHSHCILLRKKVHAEKCLFDRQSLQCKGTLVHICSPLNWCAFKNFLNFKITDLMEITFFFFFFLHAYFNDFYVLWRA